MQRREEHRDDDRGDDADEQRRRRRERAAERLGGEGLLPRARPTRNPTNAPDSIMPSMPMFTMPERSFMTPHSAPSAIGVASPRTIGAMPGVTSIT